MADITSNLSAYWPLNQNQNDYSGNGYHGVNHGQIFENNYQKFDHTYIEIGDVLNNELLSGHITISQNFYQEQHTDDYPNNDWGQIISKWNTSEDPQWRNSFIFSPWKVHLDEGYFYPEVYKLFKWYNYAFTYNNGVLKLYINGNLVKTYNNTNIGNSTGFEMRIGNMIRTNRYNFIGRLNNIRIYNRTLTDADILALYNNDKYDTNIILMDSDKSYNIVYNNIEEPKHYVLFVDYDQTYLKEQVVVDGGLQIAPIVNSTREGYTFIGWDKSVTTPITQPTLFTAQYAPIQVTVTFKDWDGTIINTQLVNYGSSQIQPSNPIREGYTFVGWDKPFNNVTSNLIVTQLYTINQYTVTITKVGQGTVTGSGTYNYGDSVTVTQSPATGYHFVDWSGDITGTETTKTFIITSEINATQTFEINTYIVNITINGLGSVIGQGTYTHGQTVTIQQTPEEGYHLQNWSGDLTGSELIKIFTITRDMNIIQNFEINTYTVNIIIDGNGSVNKIPNKSVYEHNEVLQLQQIPDIGYKFVNWAGDLNSINETENITITSNMNIQQNFEIIKFEIKTIIKPSEGGTVIGAGIYNYGSQYTLQQIPNEGYKFVGWIIGDCEE